MNSTDSMEMMMLAAHPQSVGEFLDDMVWQFDHIDTLIQEPPQFERIHNFAQRLSSDCKDIMKIMVAADWKSLSNAEMNVKNIDKLAAKIKKYGMQAKGKAISTELHNCWLQYHMLLKEYIPPYQEKATLYNVNTGAQKEQEMKNAVVPGDTMKRIDTVLVPMNK
jgi:hypothetical protein